MSKENLSKPVQREIKRHQGVEIHGGKIRLVFMWQGARRRVTLNHPLKVPSIKAAARQRAVILDEIERGAFNWEKHFPSIKNPMQGEYETTSAWTVSQGINQWLTAIELTVAPCTFRNYKSKALIHVEPALGSQPMHRITQNTLETFRNRLLKGKGPTGKPLSVKTVNDIFTVLRETFTRAVSDTSCPVDRNPCDNIKNLKRDESRHTGANPYTLAELDRMAATKTKRESEKNMIMFACWMGLSISEMIAMAWEDIDFNNWTLHVRRARVDAEFKVPKERQRDRIIEILPPAREYLKAQRLISGLLPAITVPVRQRDNVTEMMETFRPVWVNSKTQTFHPNDWVISGRFLKTFLKKAKVNYRPANQCRHTFASRALTLGMDPHWVARHMGHGSIEMLRRHYGKIIDQEVPSVSDQFMARLEHAR